MWSSPTSVSHHLAQLLHPTPRRATTRARAVRTTRRIGGTTVRTVRFPGRTVRTTVRMYPPTVRNWGPTVRRFGTCPSGRGSLTDGSDVTDGSALRLPVTGARTSV